eukprot:COSAG02_NODE_34657_length_480_cov_1.440945_1_plen_105_part_01
MAQVTHVAQVLAWELCTRVGRAVTFVCVDMMRGCAGTRGGGKGRRGSGRGGGKQLSAHQLEVQVHLSPPSHYPYPGCPYRLSITRGYDACGINRPFQTMHDWDLH